MLPSAAESRRLEHPVTPSGRPADRQEALIRMTTSDLLIFPILCCVPLIALVRMLIQMHDIADDKIQITTETPDPSQAKGEADESLRDADDLTAL